MSQKTDFLAKLARELKATCEYNSVSNDGVDTWTDRTYRFGTEMDRDLFVREFNRSGLFKTFDIIFSESYGIRLYLEFTD